MQLREQRIAFAAGREMVEDAGRESAVVDIVLRGIGSTLPFRIDEGTPAERQSIVAKSDVESESGLNRSELFPRAHRELSCMAENLFEDVRPTSGRLKFARFRVDTDG